MLILGHYAPFSLSYEQWMTLALKEIEKSDIILRIPGESSGADREVKYALELKKPIYYDIEQLLLKET